MNSDSVFFSWLMRGGDDPNTTKSRFAFRWRADDGPTLNTGLVAL